MKKILRKIERACFPCTQKLEDLLKNPEVKNDLKKLYLQNRVNIVKAINVRH